MIGVSAGGLTALKTLLPALPESFPLPIAIVQHIHASSDSYLSEYLDQLCTITVKEAEDKEPLRAGTAYLAPAGYHLLIEPERTFALSVDPSVNHSCPSIDVLFESAAEVFADSLIGIVLTGASADGSRGLAAIKARGGLAIVQNPETAETPYMPKAALAAARADHVVDLEEIAPLLVRLASVAKERTHASPGQ